MNERLIVTSFGPVKNLDITFKKVTLFIGDQGTGKSCVAKLFSLFKWLEKDLIMKRHSISYYKKNGISKLLKYHGIDVFVKTNTHIHYESALFIFTLEGNECKELQIQEQNLALYLLPKIMYIPAERLILSVAENKSKLIKELPNSCATFNDEFLEAKQFFKNGYDLPFDELHFKFDSLNYVSKIWGNGYEENPVILRNASSGIQSAFPLCVVSEFMAQKILKEEDVLLSEKENDKLSKEIEAIQNNNDYSEIVKSKLLKAISNRTRYRSFVNVVEEPELNLFPKSQFGVICALVKNATSTNQLVFTTHSPYSLAILNMLIMGAEVYSKADEHIQKKVEKILPPCYHLNHKDVAAYRLSSKDAIYCESIINPKTGMIAKNDLDSCSDEINLIFNNLYRLYANTIAK